MYKIELADGTKLENLKLNGNNFIPQSPIDSSIFENNLDKVTIIDNEGSTEEHKNMKVIFARIGETKTFVLTKKTQAEIEKEALQQRIDDLELYVLSQEGLI